MAPTVLPWLGAVTCVFLAGPLGAQRGPAGAVQDRRRPAGARRGALGDHLVRQPGAARQEDLPARPRGARRSARAAATRRRPLPVRPAHQHGSALYGSRAQTAATAARRELRLRWPAPARGVRSRPARRARPRGRRRPRSSPRAVQGVDHQRACPTSLGLDVLAHRGQPEDLRVHVVVDADDRDVTGHLEPPATGRAHHPEGHLVRRRDDTGGVVVPLEQLRGVLAPPRPPSSRTRASTRADRPGRARP